MIRRKLNKYESKCRGKQWMKRVTNDSETKQKEQSAVRIFRETLSKLYLVTWLTRRVWSSKSLSGSRLSQMRFWLERTATPWHTHREHSTSSTWNTTCQHFMQANSSINKWKWSHDHLLLWPLKQQCLVKHTGNASAQGRIWDNLNNSWCVLTIRNISSEYVTTTCTSHDFLLEHRQSLPRTTLWLHPCLSRNEMIDWMCPSLMTLSASGLSTRTQCRTSRTPANAITHYCNGDALFLTSVFGSNGQKR